ncbi:toprim domain-containing protein, partial [Vibrio cholerae]
QTNHVICCYDGDRAGRDAARRAMENALEFLNANKILKVLFLPDGEDPDSFVRKYGKTKFEEEIENSQSLIDFLLTEIKK